MQVVFLAKLGASLTFFFAVWRLVDERGTSLVKICKSDICYVGGFDKGEHKVHSDTQAHMHT